MRACPNLGDAAKRRQIAVQLDQSQHAFAFSRVAGIVVVAQKPEALRAVVVDKAVNRVVRRGAVH